MIEILTALYFVGLIFVGVSIGSYTGVSEYGFGFIGGGVILYSAIALIIHSFKD